MKLKNLVVPAAILVTLAAGSTPAGAADRQHARQGRAVPRATAPDSGRRSIGPRVIVRPRVVRPGPYRAYGYRPYVGRPYSYRPYAYNFRPRLRIGLGVFLGYPLPYPYYDPYAYPVPAYGYPGSGSMSVAPSTIGYGGVSLDITPSDAAVTVDGNLVGTVDDFNDPSHPLSLPVGRHNMQVRSPGYVPLVFDVDVVAGQVLPYQGDLQQN